MTTTNTQSGWIDAQTLKQMLDAGQVELIDVREPAEYMGEHITGARLMALSTLNPSDIKQMNGKQIVLYCQSGNRSNQAAQKILAVGGPAVMQLQGGIPTWKQAGYPVTVNKNAPISIMRQVQIIAGSLVLIGTLAGAFINPGFLFLSGFVGAGLLFAGASGFCGMAVLLAKLPYNRVSI